MKKTGYQHENERARKYWENMVNGKYYTKGEHDSISMKKVMASRKGNYFGPDTCYFAFVKDLSSGTCYVDCE